MARNSLKFVLRINFTIHYNLSKVLYKWLSLRSSIYQLSVVLISITLLSSCQTGGQTVPLDEAKEISLQFSDASFEPPPRSINDVVPKIGEYSSGARDCVSIPLFSIEEFFEQLRDATPKSKARKLNREARRELDLGRYSRSIKLLNMSIKSLPSKNITARANRYATLSKHYAYAGDLKSANR
jgi:hypothetical protein